MGSRGTQNWNVRAAGRLGTSGFAEFRTPGQRLTDRVVALRFFGDDFAVLPDVNRRAVHAGGLARDLGGAAECASNGGGEFLRFFLYRGTFHGPCSNSRGTAVELSYTLQAFARRR
jgi:hypothetical protein